MEFDVEHFRTRMRVVAGDNPKEIAYEVGISTSAIYNYLNGRIPATAILFRIAKYTGKPMEWFLLEKEPAEMIEPRQASA